MEPVRTAAQSTVTPWQLFRGFAGIGLSGFGGVMPFARRAVVERHGWLSSSEFTSLLGLSQFLPGANVGNLAICIGSRFAGWRGALAAFSGLMAAPFCLILLLGGLYGHFAHLPVVQNVLDGIAVAGGGLIIATGLRMGADLRNRPETLLIAACVAIGIGLAHWPLIVAMGLTLPPALLAAAWRLHRRADEDGDRGRAP